MGENSAAVRAVRVRFGVDKRWMQHGCGMEGGSQWWRGAVGRRVASESLSEAKGGGGGDTAGT